MTTPAEKAGQSLKTWLNTEAGFSYVRRMVHGYLRGIRHEKMLSFYFAQRFGHDPDDLGDEITQEFLEFLFRSFLPQLAGRPDQVNALLTDQTGKVLSYALQRFSWRLKDIARQKEINPRAYLHRRIREVLGQDNRFTIHRGENSSLSYSVADPDKTLPENPSAFAQADYSRWPVPPEPGSRDSLFSAGYLSGAALYFQRESAKHLAGSYLVPVRELARYLAKHHAWINQAGQKSLSRSQGLEPQTTRKKPEEHLALLRALESISVLAGQFVTTMDEQSREILYWTLADPPLSYKEIARRLELPDHNRPYRSHRKTIAAMKKFCSTWPGPPLAELPDQVGPAFIEAVRKICKKSLSRP